MLPVCLKIIALVSLAALCLAVNSDQQPIADHVAADSKPRKYNVTLDFDDLQSNASGIGFHPSHPDDPALHYRHLYLQSFTLQDTLNPALKLNDSDILCATSAPHALFFKRLEGFDWPRISLHDLSRSSNHKNSITKNSTFSLVSFTMSPTGFVPGKLGESLILVMLTMLKLPPDAPDSDQAGPDFPGLVRGAPSSLGNHHLYQLGIFLPPGEHISREWHIKDLFYPGFGTGVDVVEITAQWLHAEEDDDGEQQWTEPVDWEMCADDFVFEVDEVGVGRKQEVPSDAEDERFDVDDMEAVMKQSDKDWNGGVGYVGMTEGGEVVYGKSKKEVFEQMFQQEDIKTWQKL